MSNITFSQLKCLTITGSPLLSRPLGAGLMQLGVKEITQCHDIEIAKISIKSLSFNIAICVSLSSDNYNIVLKMIRNHLQDAICRIPIICISDDWKFKEITELRDLGVNVLGTYPLNMRNLHKQITRAISDPREFIVHKSYRGPCRRRQPLENYAGPLRRTTDADRIVPAPPIAIALPSTTSQFSAPPRLRSRPPKFNPIWEQTDRSIKGAAEAAQDVTALFFNKNISPDASTSQRTKQIVSDCIERWLNLMLLAASRIGQYGCTHQQAIEIETIKDDFVSTILEYINILLDETIDISRLWIEDDTPITLSMCETIQKHIILVDGLLELIGDDIVENTPLQAKILSARQYRNDITDRLDPAVFLNEL